MIFELEGQMLCSNSHKIEDIRDLDDDAEVDVFFISPFGLSDLLEREALPSLTPVIQQDDSFDRDDFYPATLELFTRDDRLWAIPSGVTVRVFYYNQDLFDQYDVPYPQPGWTWSDFLDTAQEALTRAQKQAEGEE
jgi:multiple sugar transport system substrate-binding protein